jgi:hypothetical protein
MQKEYGAYRKTLGKSTLSEPSAAAKFSTKN